MNNRIIVHMDMDAFFAAIEQRDFPEYRGKPVVVGADPKEGRGRGVVSTASYEARKYGIHSALPISQAYRACPHAIFATPRYHVYQETSQTIMKILDEFSPVREQISIDEAFLDCTGTEGLFGPPAELGKKIKARVYEQTRLTCSVGIAPNKFIAKVASDLIKPAGLTICPQDGEREFLAPLEIKRLWGAGKKTVAKLNSMGYYLIGDIAGAPLELFERKLGKMGTHLWRLSQGKDDRPVESDHVRKSISEEITYENDVTKDEIIEQSITRISDRLSRKMRGLDIKGRTITLKIRLEGFQTFTRSHTIDEPTSQMKVIRGIVLKEFRNFDRKNKKVRLVGIGVSNLFFNDEEISDIKGNQPELARQLDLFTNLNPEVEENQEQDLREEDPAGEEREKILDDLKERFGDTVNRGSMIGFKDPRRPELD